MQNTLTLVKPNWPAPPHVFACTTTRLGGVSKPPFDLFNLASHVEDDDEAVAKNRRQLRSELRISEPFWLTQTHSSTVIQATRYKKEILIARSPLTAPNADASFSTEKDVVCAVLTADCVPILLCNRQGTAVAAIHAGWRGLAGSIISQTVKQLNAVCAKDENDWLAWIGPAISPQHYEVGCDLKKIFTDLDPAFGSAFIEKKTGKYNFDLKAIARAQLNASGISNVYISEHCTASEPDLFFSYRASKKTNGVTGRQASLICLGAAPAENNSQ